MRANDWRRERRAGAELAPLAGRAQKGGVYWKREACSDANAHRCRSLGDGGPSLWCCGPVRGLIGWAERRHPSLD
jgi:hypothetical protein